MTFMELAQDRHSVRKYTDQKVDAKTLEQILEAGRIAPTGNNQQPQKVYVINSPEALEKINSVCQCIFGAQTVLMVTYDKDLEWKNPLEEGVAAGVQDVSIAATHMMLEAWDLGVQSCWVNFFSPTEVKKAFGLKDSEEVVMLLPIGYAAEGSKPTANHTKSRALSEIVTEL